MNFIYKIHTNTKDQHIFLNKEIESKLSATLQSKAKDRNDLINTRRVKKETKIKCT